MFQIEQDMRVVRGMESQQDPNTKGDAGEGWYGQWRVHSAASLCSSSHLLSIASFIKDLKAMENVVLITLENHTMLGKAERSSKSRERCRKAVDGSRGPVGFYLIQAPEAFVRFSPDKEHQYRLWVQRGPMRGQTGGLVGDRYPWEPSRCWIKSMGLERWLISEVLPASGLYGGTWSSMFKRKLWCCRS